MTSRASLNHVFRTVWNQALGAMVAVAETDAAPHGGGHAHGSGAPAGSAASRLGTLALGVALAWGGVPLDALANPVGGVAIQGQASFATSQPKQLLVTTQNGAGTNHSAINWQSFSIGAGETTRFIQPNAASMVINRVVTNTPSALFGTLSSNGSVVLVNQAGIAVGAGALVDTAGFTASTLGMSDADALAGRLRFGSGDLGTYTGALTVQGNLIARSGDVVLIAPSVELAQSAVVEAPDGAVLLAAGRSVEVTGRGLEGITLQVQAPSDQALNLGTLTGDAVGIFAGTLKHSGVIQATTATLEGGKVVLKAATDNYVQGDGRILATSATGKGGSIAVLGQRVAIADNALLDASGATGGGTVLVGGDYQGINPDIPNSQVTSVGADAQIHADATDQGDGGKVVVWADDTTRAYGSISARGGANGGDGGLIETSGKKLLDVTAHVDASAPNGKAGTWLLDPQDITIGTAIGSETVIDPIVITDALAIGTDVSVVTDAGQAGNGDIVVNAPLVMSPSDIPSAASLTLSASRDVAIDSTIDMRAGTGGLTVSAGGNVSVDNGGSVAVSGDVRLTTGQDVTLGLAASGTISSDSDLAIDAGRGVTVGPGGWLSAAGNATVNVGLATAGDIALSAGFVEGDTIYASGDITLRAGIDPDTGLMLNPGSNILTGGGGTALWGGGNVSMVASQGIRLGSDLGYGDAYAGSNLSLQALGGNVVVLNDTYVEAGNYDLYGRLRVTAAQAIQVEPDPVYSGSHLQTGGGSIDLNADTIAVGSTAGGIGISAACECDPGGILRLTANTMDLGGSGTIYNSSATGYVQLRPISLTSPFSVGDQNSGADFRIAYSASDLGIASAIDTSVSTLVIGREDGNNAISVGAMHWTTDLTLLSPGNGSNGGVVSLTGDQVATGRNFKILGGSIQGGTGIGIDTSDWYGSSTSYGGQIALVANAGDITLSGPINTSGDMDAGHIAAYALAGNVTLSGPITANANVWNGGHLTLFAAGTATQTGSYSGAGGDGSNGVLSVRDASNIYDGNLSVADAISGTYLGKDGNTYDFTLPNGDVIINATGTVDLNGASGPLEATGNFIVNSQTGSIDNSPTAGYGGSVSTYGGLVSMRSGTGSIVLGNPITTNGGDIWLQAPGSGGTILGSGSLDASANYYASSYGLMHGGTIKLLADGDINLSSDVGAGGGYLDASDGLGLGGLLQFESRSGSINLTGSNLDVADGMNGGAGGTVQLAADQGRITVDNAVTAGRLVASANSDIWIIGSTNSIASVAASVSGSLLLEDAVPLDIAAEGISNPALVILNADTITQTGAIHAGRLDVNAINGITLTHPDNNISTLNATNGYGGYGGDISFSSSSGWLDIVSILQYNNGDNISITNSGNINFTTAGASNITAHGGTVTLTSSGGTITNLGGASLNVDADSIHLNAASGIGTSAQPVGVNDNYLASLHFNNTASDVFISSPDVMHVDDGYSGGNITLISTGGTYTTSRIQLNRDIGNVTAGGSVTYQADHFDVLGTGTYGLTTAGTSVTLMPYTSGWAIDLGAKVGLLTDSLEISSAEINTISAPTLVIGDGYSGNLNVSAALAPSGVTRLVLNTGATGATITELGPQGGLGAITVDSLSLYANGDVTLDAYSNDVGSLAAGVSSGHSIAFNNLQYGSPLDITGVTAPNGSVTLTAQSLTQSGAIQAQSLDVTTSAGFVLDNAANQVTSLNAINWYGGDIRLVDNSSSLTLGSVYQSGGYGGSISITNSGSIAFGPGGDGANVSAYGGTVSLNSTNGAIVNNLGSTSNIHADQINLTSYGGIGGFGSAVFVEENAGASNPSLQFDNTGVGEVFITSPNVMHILSGSTIGTAVGSGTGNITLISTGASGSSGIVLNRASGNVSAGNGVTYQSDHFDVLGSGIYGQTSADYVVHLHPYTPGRSIDAGAKPGDLTKLEISSAELDTIHATLLAIGDLYSGNLNVSAPLAPVGISQLVLNAGLGSGAITQDISAPISVSRLTAYAHDYIALPARNQVTDFFSDNLGSGDIVFTGIGPLNLVDVFNSGGRWLIYADDPASLTKNGLTSDFRHYSATYASYAQPTEAGNGIVYASAPGQLVVDTTLSSGSASHVYGDTPTAVYGYSFFNAASADNEDLALISGALSVTPTIDSITDAGSYSVLYAGGLFSAAGYTFSTGSGLSYTVQQAPLSLSPDAGLVGSTTKVYDGTMNATLTPNNFQLTGFVNGDSAGVIQTSGTYTSKNVGSGIVVTTTLTPSDFSPIGDTKLSNYILPTSASGAIGVITPLAITGSFTAANKVYDGTSAATISTTSLAGSIAGDAVSYGGGSATFADRNVGTALTVSASGMSLSGADALNYTVNATASTSADITQRPLSTWSGAGGNALWSNAANWDALPVGGNVAAVSIPAGSAVVFDASADATTLESLNSSGALVMNAGALQINNSLLATSFAQSGGALSGSGNFSVNGSFSQSGGSIAMDGIAITQASGPLSFSSLSGQSVALTAQNGAIGQTGALAAGHLVTQSTAGTVLNDAGNHIDAWQGSNSGSGPIALTAVNRPGVLLDVQGITNAGGDITLIDTGGIVTSGLIRAPNGKISITTNSPLTVGSPGISSYGNIVLTATNLTSAGNMLLDGPITSTGGSVTMSAANDLTQNSAVFGLYGVSASAGGTLTFGPNATSGNPMVSYTAASIVGSLPATTVNGTVVYLPQVTDSAALLSFLDDFQTLLASSQEEPWVLVGELSGVYIRPRLKDLIVTEGELCRP